AVNTGYREADRAHQHPPTTLWKEIGLLTSVEGRYCQAQAAQGEKKVCRTGMIRGVVSAPSQKLGTIALGAPLYLRYSGQVRAPMRRDFLQALGLGCVAGACTRQQTDQGGNHDETSATLAVRVSSPGGRGEQHGRSRGMRRDDHRRGDAARRGRTLCGAD